MKCFVMPKFHHWLQGTPTASYRWCVVLRCRCLHRHSISLVLPLLHAQQLYVAAPQVGRCAVRLTTSMTHCCLATPSHVTRTAPLPYNHRLLQHEACAPQELPALKPRAVTRPNHCPETACLARPAASCRRQPFLQTHVQQALITHKLINRVMTAPPPGSCQEAPASMIPCHEQVEVNK